MSPDALNSEDLNSLLFKNMPGNHGGITLFVTKLTSNLAILLQIFAGQNTICFSGGY